jgi:hypothetical protein
MYYPKHQLQINLHTNGGELINSSTQKSYVGPYWKTSKDEYFSGSSPKDPLSVPLIPIPKSSLELNNQSPPSLIKKDETPNNTNLGPTGFYIEDTTYYSAKNIPFNRNSPLPPKSFYPTPTQDDYNTGKINRYFAKKTNDAQFIEISLEDHNRMINRDPSILFIFYNSVQVHWLIKGNRDYVFNENKKTITEIEKNGFSGLTSFINNKFDLFWRS